MRHADELFCAISILSLFDAYDATMPFTHISLLMPALIYAISLR